MIDTPRLLLRPYALTDFDAIHALRSDAETMRFIGGKALTREESWQRLMRAAGHWALLGFGFFVVVEKAGGRVIGEAGLMRAERGLGEQFDPYPEAGWLLSPQGRGHGYAQEAMRAALAWFAESHGPSRSVCIIDPANAASLRLAQKLGYKAFGTTHYKDSEVTMLERGGRPGESERRE